MCEELAALFAAGLDPTFLATPGKPGQSDAPRRWDPEELDSDAAAPTNLPAPTSPGAAAEPSEEPAWLTPQGAAGGENRLPEGPENDQEDDERERDAEARSEDRDRREAEVADDVAVDVAVADGDQAPADARAPGLTASETQPGGLEEEERVIASVRAGFSILSATIVL